MSERRAFRVTGVVQGVGFRWWTRQTAQSLGLRGTVRNARDGSVEVQASGDPDTLDRFAGLLHQGPPSARVDNVQRREPDKETLPAGFEITR